MPDPLGHASDISLYRYANGDPINYIDPRAAQLDAVDKSSCGTPDGFANKAAKEIASAISLNVPCSNPCAALFITNSPTLHNSQNIDCRTPL
ncbi:MAG: hypothetical protein RML49_08420 [Verrucomicrobiae bacterium]|nr:hypothetical protein [Verrucomicrobiae bacterium]